MFENAYQGGPLFEILSGHSRELGKNWKMSRSVTRSYTADIKGYSYITQNGKLSIPIDNSAMILLHHYVLFQAHITSGANLSVEFATQDLFNHTKRFFFSTSIKEVKITPLHVTLPLSLPKTTGWVNLCFDVQSLITKYFSGTGFKAIVGISLHGSLKIRKIVTLQDRPMVTGEEDVNSLYLYKQLNPIPKLLDLPAHIPIVTVPIGYATIPKNEPLQKSVETKPISPIITAFGRSLPKVCRIPLYQSLSKIKQSGIGSKSGESLVRKSSKVFFESPSNFVDAAVGLDSALDLRRNPSPAPLPDESMDLKTKIDLNLVPEKPFEKGTDLELEYASYIANRRTSESQSTSAITLKITENFDRNIDENEDSNDDFCNGWDTTISPIQKSLETMRFFDSKKVDRDERYFSFYFRSDDSSLFIYLGNGATKAI